MSENPEKRENKTKPEEIKESVSSQEKSGSSEQSQDKHTETTDNFCNNVSHNMRDIKMGALFAGAENVVNGAKKIDTIITRGVNGLLSNVTVYFRNSIDSYRKTRK